MVYFGSNHFGEGRTKTRTSGLSTRDRIRIGVMAGLVLVMVPVLFGIGKAPPPSDSSRFPEQPRPETFELQPAPDGSVPLSLPDPLVADPKPFIEDPSILASVIDGADGGTDETPENRRAVDYLFQRWRCEVPIEVLPEEDIPEWRSYSRFASSLRGERHRLFLTLVDPPFHRSEQAGPENLSGTDRYWELWGVDTDIHLHRVLFLEQDGVFLAGDLVELDADFLRVHQFQTQEKGWAGAPQWVAHRLEEYEPPSWNNSWTPIYWVIGVSFGGLVILGLLLWRQDQSNDFESRRKKARNRSKDSDGNESPDARPSSA